MRLWHDCERRTGNALEFDSKFFNEVFNKQVIKTHRNIDGTSQKNVFVECMKNKILKRVRCMLFGVGLAKMF